MAELADGFIALPGGLGTLEEIFEIWDALRLNLYSKPFALFNVENFYKGLLHHIDYAVDEAFIASSFKNLLYAYDNCEMILQQFIGTEAAQPQALHYNFEQAI